MPQSGRQSEQQKLTSGRIKTNVAFGSKGNILTPS
jgi:hypothetical protein